MTLLTTSVEVAKRVGIKIPTAVAAGTQRHHKELLGIANRAASRINRSHYWQRMMAVATITGDGSDVDFALEDDYLRMDKDTKLWSSALVSPLKRIVSRDDWLYYETTNFDTLINRWTLYGDIIYIKPALASAVTVQYFYQQNTPVQATGGGSRKTAFTADNDVFLLDEELLKLAMIYMWKDDKGQAYQEAMQDYENLLASKISSDKGARTIRVGRRRLPSDVRTAYPYVIS